MKLKKKKYKLNFGTNNFDCNCLRLNRCSNSKTKKRKKLLTGMDHSYCPHYCLSKCYNSTETNEVYMCRECCNIFEFTDGNRKDGQLAG